MNLYQTAKRLQTALCLQGRHIRINQIQYYSEKAEKMCTIYKVLESVLNDEEMKKETVEYCSSSSMVDVVKTLHALYKGGE